MAGMKVLLLVFLLWGFLFCIAQCQQRHSCDQVTKKSGMVYKWHNFDDWHECWNISVSPKDFISLQMTRLETEFNCENYYITIQIAGSSNVHKFCTSQFNKDPIIAFNDVTINYFVKPRIRIMNYFTIEYIIRTRECLKENRFVCDDYECVSKSKLCDGVKDCENGEDEKRCECDCGSNGECGFVKDQKKCYCQQGFVEKDGKCTECDCGVKGSCRFQNDKKICSCASGFLEKGGKCTECDCGINGGCRFEKNQKKCDCQQGSVEKDGTCTECNCGTDGTCTFVKGEKKCDCKQGYADIDGTCRACVCRGGNCVSKEGKTACQCPPGYGNFTNISCKACDCGSNTSCIWDAKFGGRKICLCDQGYSTKMGKCVACECGSDSNCEWISDGWLKPERKVCHCKTGYWEENGKCVDFRTSSSSGTTETPIASTSFSSTAQDCHCGPFSSFCSVDSLGERVCNCLPGYSQLKGTCIECNCGPYGTCNFEYGLKKCCCKSFAIEIKGVCLDIRDSSSKAVFERPIISKSLVLSQQECNCGPYGTCSFKFGRKKCNCRKYTIEKNGVCVDKQELESIGKFYKTFSSFK